MKINSKYFPKLIKGDVLKTLKDPKNIPEKISILRLDTDLYLTTKIQLEMLYPKLRHFLDSHNDQLLYYYMPFYPSLISKFLYSINGQPIGSSLNQYRLGASPTKATSP